MFASPLKDGLIVLVIVLLFFGPKRLPALSRSIGESIKEFKGGINEATGSSETQALNSAPQAPTTESRQPVDAGAERSS
jgi:sec-independent protein translocase protein TatA